MGIVDSHINYCDLSYGFVCFRCWPNGHILPFIFPACTTSTSYIYLGLVHTAGNPMPPSLSSNSYFNITYACTQIKLVVFILVNKLK